MSTPSRFRTLYRDWLHLWIPVPFADDEVDRAAQLTALVASVGFVVSCLVLSVRLATAEMRLVWSVLVVTLGFAATLGLLRLRRPRTAAHLMIACVVLGSTYSHWASPALLTPVLALIVAPLFAGVFAGARSAVWWGLCGAVLLGASSALRHFIPTAAPETTVFIGNSIVAPIVLFGASVLAALIEHNRTRTRKALIEAMQTARLATDAKTRFLAHMSHEIRTPMNGVIGLADLLDGTDLNDDQRAMTATLRQSASALLHIINQILDFSKVEAGHLELFERPFSIRRIAEEVVALLNGAAKRRGLTLVLDWQGPPELSWVVGDPERTRQIFVNLIGNALKFTDSGSVTLSGRTRAGRDGRALVAVAVKDTGLGIAPESLGTLFQEFKQLDPSNGHRESTGLGLAITARLVKLMGSTVAVSSEVGVGSTFSFELDMELAEDGEGLTETSAVWDIMSPHPSLPQPLYRRVLVVDDNAVNRMVLGRLLERLEIEVVSLDSGQAALDLLAQDRDFDCVMCDCRMPDLDGYETTRRLRQRELEQSQPRMIVIAVTASVLTDERNNCTEAGMDGFLSKPVRIRDLRRCLRQWVPALVEKQADTDELVQAAQ